MCALASSHNSFSPMLLDRLKMRQQNHLTKFSFKRTGCKTANSLLLRCFCRRRWRRSPPKIRKKLTTTTNISGRWSKKRRVETVVSMPRYTQNKRETEPHTQQKTGRAKHLERWYLIHTICARCLLLLLLFQNFISIVYFSGFFPGRCCWYKQTRQGDDSREG